MPRSGVRRRCGGRRSQFVEDGDELGVYRRRPVTERLDGIGFSEAVETREQTNALTAGEFDLGRAPAEEQAIQFTVSEQFVKFVDRDVDKKQHHQPYLN